MHVPALRRAATREHYDLHRVAHEWSLADPIVIQSAEDLKSRLDWRDRVQPFAHQMRNLFTFCRRLPVTLIADDVGLGKTISAGLIISELIARRRVRRVLVLAPSILLPQWREELESKFGIRAREVKGAGLDQEVARPTDAQVVITTYESARSRLSSMRPDAFEMVVLDEAHRLRNLHGTESSPLLAREVRAALEQRRFRYVLMLTATPIQNRLWDMYSLIDCLTAARGHKNPLGDPNQFAQRFIADRSGRARRLNPRYADEFRDILRQYIVRTRRDDAGLVFPTRAVQTRAVRPSDKDREVFELVKSVVFGMNGLAQTSILQASVSSPEALATQLENMARNRTVPMSMAQSARQIADKPGPTAKLALLGQIVAELRAARPANWRVVVFTTRKETQRAIAEYLRGQGIGVGLIDGENPRGRQSAIEGFRVDPPLHHVIVSTDAGAEGVNLQSGNVIVNYDLPWNPMRVEQRIGRIQRLGSTHANVIVANLVLAGSFEHHIVAVLAEKLQVIAETVGDIEALLEAADLESDDDTSSYESRIRELVLKALQGQDVRVATEQALESIQQAKRMHEEQSHELDATLGRCDDLHEFGPRMPKIERANPSMSVQDFVLATLRLRGGMIRNDGPDLYYVHRGDAPSTHFTFLEEVHRRETQDGFFSGRAPLLFVPGHRDFERHTAHWAENYALLLDTQEAPESAQIDSLLREWTERFPGLGLESVVTVSGGYGLNGSVLCRAKVVNAVDSYECLFELNVDDVPDGVSASNAGASSLPIGDEHRVDRLIPRLQDRVAAAVGRRDDIVEFRRFYKQRLTAELAHASGDIRREKKVRDDFDPTCFAEVVGTRGTVRRRHFARATFRVDGAVRYTVELPLSAEGRLDPEPETIECAISGRRMPVFAQEVCSVSGRRALRHLMETSQLSGRWMLPSHAVTCSESGTVFHPDEVGRCEETGNLVDPKLLARSAVSGKQVLARLLVASDFSEDRALPGELVSSEVSGRKTLATRAVRSAVSGVTGDECEFVRCAVSGDWMLPGESGRSSVSGQTVRADLLRRSEKSPTRLGLDSEFVTCAVTGKKLLADEAVRSERSGRIFDKDLAAKSDVSNRVGAPDEMETCSVSGRRCMDDELSTCPESGRRALREYLVKSVVSQRLIHPDSIVRSARGGRPAGASEVRRCSWSGRILLPSEFGRCELTGNEFDVDQLEAERLALSALIRLLRRGDGGPESVEVDVLVRMVQDPRLKGLRSIRAETAPSGDLIGVCASVIRLWPPGRDWLLFVVSKASLVVLGTVARCRRGSTGLIESFEVVE